MRTGRQSPDFHLIKTKTDALYYAADIPSTAWGPFLTEVPQFKLVVFDEDNVSQQIQATWFSKLRSGEMFPHPYLVLVTSDADDDLTVAQGYDLMKRALSKNLRVQITESSTVKEEKSNEETVFMLTNVYDEAPPERIQLVRDWCYRHKTCFRIICAAGSPSVLVRKLRLKFNAVFFLDSKVVSEKSFA